MLTEVTAKTRRPLLDAGAVRQAAGILRALRWLLGDLSVVDYDDDKEVLAEVQLTNEAMDDLVRRDIVNSREAANRYAHLFKGMSRNERDFGELYFKGNKGLKEVHFWFDELGLVPRGGEIHFGNSLSVVWEDENSGEQLAEVCLAVMERMFDNDLFDYGYCCVSEQYDEKNMDYSGGGAQAVGLDVSKSLPGFYWGNYFGEYLCGVIGRETLLNLPGCISHEARSGVIVVNSQAPDEWCQDRFVATERTAIDRVGSHLFFEKGKDHSGLCWSNDLLQPKRRT